MFAHARRLRWSGEKLGYTIDIAGVADPSVDIGVPAGAALIRLVDAFLVSARASHEEAREAVMEAAGPEALVDAAAVFANFEMMNRVAEGTGLPVPQQAVRRESRMVNELGLDRLLKSKGPSEHPIE